MATGGDESTNRNLSRNALAMLSLYTTDETATQRRDSVLGQIIEWPHAARRDGGERKNGHNTTKDIYKG